MAVAVLLAGAVLWGLYWWPLKALAQAGVSGPLVPMAAYGVSALTLAPLVWVQRRQWRPRLGVLALIALLGGWANASFTTTLTHGSVVRVMLLFYLSPVWTVLAARVVLGEPVTPLRLAALATAMAGLVTTLGGTAVLEAPLAAMDLLALSSGLAFALTNVAMRAAQGVSDAVRATALFSGCAGLCGVFAVVTGDPAPLPEGPAAAGLAALGLLWVLPATLATYYGVARLEAGRAGILLLSEMVVGLVSAVLLGNETLGPREAVGGALVLAAAALEARGQGQTVRTGEQPA